MSATMPPPFLEADVADLIQTCRQHDEGTLLYLLVMSIEHAQALATEAEDGAIYNTLSCARVALCELALKGFTLTEDTLGEALERLHPEEAEDAR